MAFTSPESIAVEGDDDVTICLSVISGDITTPTNITLTTVPAEGLVTDFGAQPRPIIEDRSAFGESSKVMCEIKSLALIS